MAGKEIKSDLIRSDLIVVGDTGNTGVTASVTSACAFTAANHAALRVRRLSLSGACLDERSKWSHTSSWSHHDDGCRWGVRQAKAPLTKPDLHSVGLRLCRTLHRRVLIGRMGGLCLSDVGVVTAFQPSKIGGANSEAWRLEASRISHYGYREVDGGGMQLR